MSQEDMKAHRVVLLAAFEAASAAWQAAKDAGDRSVADACSDEMRTLYREMTEVEAALKAS